MKRIHLASIVVTLMMMFSCSGPKFAGLKKETVETKQFDVVSKRVTNYQMQLGLLNQIQPGQQVMSQLEKDKVTIVANYSQYPFNTKKGDNPDTSYITDNNINGELSIVLEKSLIQSGYKVLENYSAYNAILDNNFDEFQQMLVFDVKGLGLYYEHVSDDLIIRHADCNVRFKVLDKDGTIKTISDVSLNKKDTITATEIPTINQLPVSLSYQTIKQDNNLSSTNLPSVSSGSIQTIYTVPPKESIDAIEKVVGLRFEVPNETKTYSILVLDNISYTELIRSKGKNISKSDIFSLSPKNVSIKSNEKSVERGGDGSKTYTYYSTLNAADLSALFEKSKEVVLINKLKKICVLRQLNDGTIVPIQ